MQIRGINNQPDFRGIYVTKNIEFTEGQKKLVDSIINSLREPLPRFRNKTAENFYKSKKGFDFGIRINHNLGDRAYLELLKDAKMVKTETGDVLTYKEDMAIGIYDNNNPFKIEDIKKIINANKEMTKPWLVPALGCFLALCSFIGIKLSDKPKQISKPVTETIDTISTKAKTVLSDTTAINTKILKIIKK